MTAVPRAPHASTLPTTSPATPEQASQRRREVVQADRVLGRLTRQFALDARAGQPDAVGVRVMVASADEATAVPHAAQGQATYPDSRGGRPAGHGETAPDG